MCTRLAQDHSKLVVTFTVHFVSCSFSDSHMSQMYQPESLQHQRLVVVKGQSVNKVIVVNAGPCARVSIDLSGPTTHHHHHHHHDNHHHHHTWQTRHDMSRCGQNHPGGDSDGPDRRNPPSPGASSVATESPSHIPDDQVHGDMTLLEKPKAKKDKGLRMSAKSSVGGAIKGSMSARGKRLKTSSGGPSCRAVEDNEDTKCGMSSSAASKSRVKTGCTA